MDSDALGVSDAASEYRARIRAANSSGEFLQAYDIAEQALDAFPDDLGLAYESVLALARTRAPKAALQRYDRLALEARAAAADRELQTDVLALRGRLEKDLAFLEPAAQRPSAFFRAARTYAAVYERTHAAFPAINAATLLLLGGNQDAARDFAQTALSLARSEPSATPMAAYYRNATIAEAALILGDAAVASDALADAARVEPADLAARSTTRRQIRLICEHLRIDDSLLALLKPPASMHYTGHRFGDEVSKEQEGSLAASIRKLLDERNVGFAFGSLAAGADILFAEAVLERGCELAIVLPFNLPEFRRISVAPHGESWVGRFDRVLARANSVLYATDGEYMGDDSLFGYAAQLAMGLAQLKALLLNADALQIALWDGVESSSETGAGTGSDAALWRTTGLPQILIPFARRDAPSPKRLMHGRVLRALVFGDIKGFSRLGDHQIRTFVDEVLARFGRVLDAYGDGVSMRNTWGDGLYFVASDAATAADCALMLQDAAREAKDAAPGLPAEMGLRLAVHVGPVLGLVDPITKLPNYFGSHVSRTARIEPVTPEGAVYATEPFAAEIALRARDRFRCEYVGRIPAAKGYGTLRMYALQRAEGTPIGTP